MSNTEKEFFIEKLVVITLTKYSVISIQNIYIFTEYL